MAIEERDLDDAALVEAAQQGDDEAFSELFRRHYPSVRRVCARRLGSVVDGDEVAQAAFVRAYERLDQCGGERRFGAWIQVIAYRLGADTRRRQARAVPTDDPGADDAAVGSNQCEEAVLRAERAAEVHEVLATLPPRQREVIVARDLEGQRPGEIAASLGLSLGAVDSLLLRARRRMATSWRLNRLEGGATSTNVTGASVVATSAAEGPRRLLNMIRDAISGASYHVAAVTGAIPGQAPAASRVGAMAMAAVVAGSGAAVAGSRTPVAGPAAPARAGAAAPSPAPAHPTVPAVPVTVPAARVGVPPVPPPATVLPPVTAPAPPGAPVPGATPPPVSADPAVPVTTAVNQTVGAVSQTVTGAVSTVSGGINAATGVVHGQVAGG